MYFCNFILERLKQKIIIFIIFYLRHKMKEVCEIKRQLIFLIIHKRWKKILLFNDKNVYLFLLILAIAQYPFHKYLRYK